MFVWCRLGVHLTRLGVGEGSLASPHLTAFQTMTRICFSKFNVSVEAPKMIVRSLSYKASLINQNPQIGPRCSSIDQVEIYLVHRDTHQQATVNKSCSIYSKFNLLGSHIPYFFRICVVNIEIQIFFGVFMNMVKTAICCVQ